jgi:hypothetical protein
MSINAIMVKRNKTIFCFLFLPALLFTGCAQRDVLEAHDYLKWFEQPDNGATASKEIGDFEFSILYKPVDYILALESRGRVLPEEQLKKRKQELEGFQYYTFRIKSNKDQEFFRTGMQAENDYYVRLEYFISMAQDDICLVEGSDTLVCAVYHFERNYGVSPYSHIVLSFPEPDSLNSRDKVFIYNDKVLGTGKVIMKISADQLTDLPTLNI